MDKVKPLHHIRYGNVESSIWENLTQGGGAFYNVTFAKHGSVLKVEMDCD